MKLFYILVILFAFNNCSFDNKTGIWKNDNVISTGKDENFKEFRKISYAETVFDKTVELKNNIKISIPYQVENKNWMDVFFDKSNNTENFKYSNLRQIKLKSKKISKYKINKDILFVQNKLITNDIKGNIIIFSMLENKVISKFNFYKKKYKKIEKNLNLIIENNIIYISDNIGYLYAYNFNKDKIVWAKNYKIPFNSNLKIYENKIIAANINNNLLILEKNTGDMLKKIPTEETIVQNTFTNNLSQNKNSTLFLNSYGSLYSIDKKLNINWFLNLNPAKELIPSNLFSGNQIVTYKNLIVVPANNSTYILNSSSGSIIHKVNFSSSIKPIILDEYLLMISKNNLLILFDIINAEIIYSYNINEKIANFLNTKPKNVQFKSLSIADDHILVFLQNSYVIKFYFNGNIDEIYKLPSKIYSKPIFVEGNLVYLNSKRQLISIN